MKWYLSWWFYDGYSSAYEVEEFTTKEECEVRIIALKDRYFKDDLRYTVIYGEERSL